MTVKINGHFVPKITYTTDDGLTSSYTECLGSGLGIINSPYIAGINVRMFITIGGQPVTNSIDGAKPIIRSWQKPTTASTTCKECGSRSHPSRAYTSVNGKKHTAK